MVLLPRKIADFLMIIKTLCVIILIDDKNTSVRLNYSF